MRAHLRSNSSPDYGLLFSYRIVEELPTILVSILKILLERTERISCRPKRIAWRGSPPHRRRPEELLQSRDRLSQSGLRSVPYKQPPLVPADLEWKKERQCQTTGSQCGTSLTPLNTVGRMTSFFLADRNHANRINKYSRFSLTRTFFGNKLVPRFREFEASLSFHNPSIAPFNGKLRAARTQGTTTPTYLLRSRGAEHLVLRTRLQP